MDPKVVEQTISLYMSTWSETDSKAMRDNLSKCWDAKGVYTDPLAQIAGPENLANYMQEFQKSMPNTKFVLMGAVDTHHGQLHIKWNMVDKEENILQSGNSFGEISSEGKLIRMTGFFPV